MNARGVFAGLGLNHKREHLFRAVLEGVAFNIKLLLDRFEQMSGQELPELIVIGGGTRNPFWMKLLADISGRRITTPSLKQEANCFGAAQAAGVGVGLYEDFGEVKKLVRVEDEYLPDDGLSDFYAKKYEIFREAYQGMLKAYNMIADLEEFAAA